MKKGYIFDLDGTLLDSMHVWEGVGTTYLHMKHKTPKESRSSLDERFSLMTLHEAACYFKERYDMSASEETIISEITSLVSERYQHELKLKDGVKAVLETLYQQGCKMCVVTATDHGNAVAALKNNDIYDMFAFVLSTEDCKLNKRNADIYQKAVHDLGIDKEACVVVEDALHAMKGAKKADLCVYAMYDESSKKDWEEILEVADKTFTCMKQMEEVI